jgi:hypothetical protein
MVKPKGQQIAEAWLVASSELGIEVVAPFFLRSADGKAIEYALFSAVQAHAREADWLPIYWNIGKKVDIRCYL